MRAIWCRALPRGAPRVRRDARAVLGVVFRAPWCWDGCVGLEEAFRWRSGPAGKLRAPAPDDLLGPEYLLAAPARFRCETLSSAAVRLEPTPPHNVFVAAPLRGR